MALNFLYDGYFAGKVGIGTETPSRDGLNVFHTTGPYVHLTNTTTGDLSSDGGYISMIGTELRLGNQEAGGTLSIFTNNSTGNGITILSTGNVGIGTTTPYGKLSVTGASAVTGDAGIFQITDGTGANTDSKITMGVVASDYGWIQAVKPGTDNLDLALNVNGGNVGIGTTTPLTKLHVTGSTGITIENTSTTNVQLNFKSNSVDTWRIGQNLQVSGATALEFYDDVNNVDRMVITNTGYVGIGTTTPVTLLSNTATRIGNADGLTTHLSGVNWEVNGQGYTAAFSNLATAAAQHNAGVLVEIAGTDATDKILDLESGGVNRFRMLGTGDATFAGNAGIGMTAGTIPTEIKGRASDGKSLRLWDNAGTDILDLYNNGTNAYINTTHSGGAGNPLIIQTNSITALTLDTSQDATFTGNIRTGTSSLTANTNFDNLVIEGSAHTGITIFSGASSDGAIYFGDATATDSQGQIKYLHGSNDMTFATNDGSASLTLDSGLNATFAGDVTIGGKTYPKISLTDNQGVARTFSVGTSNETFTVRNETASSDAFTISNANNATFAGTVDGTTATFTTFSGDLNGTINTLTTAVTKGNATDDTTVATTAFVQNVIGTIPAGLVFQGTWNASTNTPTLASGTGTTGYFYIVSVAGTTNLDGITDWEVGDWAVFIEQGASDQWEKIDNSSVLSGSGTGQKVTKWDGSGTSVTLTDGPITFSGNDATFAGDITFGDSHFIGDDGDDNLLIQSSAGENIIIDSEDDIILDANGADIRFKDGGTEFGKISKGGGSDLVISSSIADKDIFLTGIDGVTAITALTLDMSNGGNATFAGSVTSNAIPAFLVGTIGAIGNTANDVNIYSTTAGHNGLRMHVNGILPTDNAGTIIDNDADLGDPGYRFKDGYFAGSVTGSNFIISDGTSSYIQFDLNGKNSHFTSQSKSYIWAGQGASGDYLAGTLNFQSRSSLDRDINFITGATPAKRLIISGSGNATFAGKVGIGITPVEMLDIQSASGDARIRLDAPASSDTEIKFYNAGVAQYTIGHDDATDNFVIGGANVDAPMVSVDKSGNVGIGTTAPTNYYSGADNFVIKQASGEGGMSIVTANDTSGAIYFADGVTGSEQYRGGIGYTHTTDKLFFVSGGSTKAWMDTDGNVGIGYSDPSDFTSVGADNLVIGPLSGNNGITVNSATTGYGALAFADGTGANDQYRGLIQYSHTADSLALFTNATTKMTILSSGNVGIGTTSPATDLHVNSENAEGSLTLSRGGTNMVSGQGVGSIVFPADYNGTPTNYGKIVTYANALSAVRGSLDFKVKSTSGTLLTGMTVYGTSSGVNVGIGATDPVKKLDVRGQLAISNSASSYWYLDRHDSTGYFEIFDDGDVNRLTIDTSGNVGIGTTSPSEKLHVSGNARVTGAYYDSNNSAGTSGQVLSSTATGTDWVSAGGTSGFAPMVKFNRSGINSSTYTMIATVNGDNLASIIQMTMTGTSGSVVFACTFDITVNHSQDIHVKSMSGDYTDITLKITSDNNEDYSIEAKHNGSTTTTAEIVIFPLANETITPTTTDPGYTGAEYEHTATDGWRFGGEDNSVESSNVIIDGNVGINNTTPTSNLQVGPGTSNASRSLIASFGGASDSMLSTLSLVNTAGNDTVGNGAAIDFHVASTYSPTARIAGIAEDTSVNTGLAFYTYSSGTLGERMRIDSAGNVGIGTTAPSSLLTLNKVTGAVGILLEGNGTDVGKFQLSSAGVNHAVQIGSVSNNEVQFHTVNSEKMRITPTGDVGIGTTVPSSKVHILGGSNNTVSQANANLNIEGAGGNGVVIGTMAASTYGSYLQAGYVDNFATATYPLVLNPLGGNVGIGTTSPTYKLTVESDVAHGGMLIEGNNAPGLSLRDHSSTSESKIYIQSTASSSGNLRISSDNNNTATTPTIEFLIGGSEKMRITDNGNVGIGDTTPDYRLAVKKVNAATPAIMVSGAFYGGPRIQTYGLDADANAWMGLGTDMSGGAYEHNIYFSDTGSLGRLSIGTYNGTTYSEKMCVLRTGNVGIGTDSPATELQVGDYTDLAETITIATLGDGTGRINFYDGNNTEGGSIRVVGGGQGSKMYFANRWNTDNDRVVFDLVTGNVGIGTTSPDGKLEIEDTTSRLGTTASLIVEGRQDGAANVLTLRSKDYSAPTVAIGANHGAIMRWQGFDGTDFENMGYIFVGADGQSVANGDAPSYMTFGTSADGSSTPSERMRIDSSGNVTIQTSGADDIKNFTINSSNGSSQVAGLIIENDGANGYINFKLGSGGAAPTTKLTIGNAANFGNVGIGTTSPKTKLNIVGGDVQLDSGQMLSFYTGASTGVQNNGIKGSDVDDSLRFYTGALERVTIKGANVGIGTTNPAQNFVVAEGTDQHGIELVPGTLSYIQAYDRATSAYGGMTIDTKYLAFGLDNGTEKIRFTDEGKVGIGTTVPNKTLDVQVAGGDGIRVSNSTNSAYNCELILNYNDVNTMELDLMGTTILQAGNTANTVLESKNGTLQLNGQVGVNQGIVTSGVQLEVNGVGLIKDSTGVGDFYLGNYATGNYFRFHTNNANTYFDMNCGDMYWRQGSSIRYYFYASTANMTINGTLTQNSDSRVKENIVEIDDCIGKVQAMRGVYYNRTDFNTEVTKVGVIAQEVETVLPELILESPEDGLKSVAYSELTAVLINAVKEQQEIIEDLKTRIEQLEN
jgi:hypothetical protein